MSEATVQIDEVRLRLPGVSAEAARRIGEAVARDLAARGIEPQTASLAALDLRLALPSDTPPSRLAALIADAVARRLAAL
jgi:hypothetical protein